MNYFSYKNFIETAFSVVDLAKEKVKTPTKFLDWTRVNCKGFGDGYDNFSLRADIAGDAQECIDYLESIQVYISSSGGKRRPSHQANANQAQFSLHVLGLAFDLWVYGGGFWDRDDFVIERDPNDARRWIVWGKSHSDVVPIVTIRQWSHKKQKHRKITGRFVNLTTIFRGYGFVGIPSRRSYPHSYGGAEWWHFQHVSTLVKNETNFYKAALLVWKKKDLVHIDKNHVWNGKYFKRVS